MIPTVNLNNGVLMPMLGLGTSKLDDGDEAERAVRSAIDVGYRLIDTAKRYGNEASVGKAVRECGLKREELFITTKLWPTDFFDPQQAFDESLSRLDTGYIDLYLIHWPAPVMPKSLWQVMEKIYASKKVRAIGVSNYDVGELEKLLSYCEITPVVNQIRFSPFSYQRETLEFCKKNDVIIEAYSPLTRGASLDDKTVAIVARKYNRSPAQIMLRWCTQQGTIPLPKSSNPARQRENMSIFDFELSLEDMQTLDTLSCLALNTTSPPRRR